ncbi:hypothetical protein [Candidatus Mycolicibacterium alkanivorans]|uniref:Uncharacterized protein n=1 Tax=Candidatus Mycolicibacterium alkanivorans TaxID=2954114 RepID=A0ABS9YXB8_9MYCO|nr:hypothetical protein [Candidatus Mycolicibacterium alkanivorans]MCI4675860.1 hypothetical protein [Candidatus Mycolicibacterium alkanivorans]
MSADVAKLLRRSYRLLAERVEPVSTVGDDIDALRIDYMTRVGEMTATELRDELQRVTQRASGGEQTAIVEAEQQRRRGVLPRPPL